MLYNTEQVRWWLFDILANPNFYLQGKTRIKDPNDRWYSKALQHFRLTFEQATADPECLLPVRVDGFRDELDEHDIWLYFRMMFRGVDREVVYWKIPFIVKDVKYASLLRQRRRQGPPSPQLLHAAFIFGIWSLALTIPEATDNSNRRDQCIGEARKCLEGPVADYLPLQSMEAYKSIRRRAHELRALMLNEIASVERDAGGQLPQGQWTQLRDQLAACALNKAYVMAPNSLPRQFLAVLLENPGLVLVGGRPIAAGAMTTNMTATVRSFRRHLRAIAERVDVLEDAVDGIVQRLEEVEREQERQRRAQVRHERTILGIASRVGFDPPELSNPATIIQRWVRGHLARCLYAVFQASATTIQRIVRGVLTRRRIDNREDDQQEPDAVFQASATTIQCLVRRHLARCLRRRMIRERFAAFEASATTIQRFVRRIINREDDQQEPDDSGAGLYTVDVDSLRQRLNNVRDHVEGLNRPGLTDRVVDPQGGAGATGPPQASNPQVTDPRARRHEIRRRAAANVAATDFQRVYRMYRAKLELYNLRRRKGANAIQFWYRGCLVQGRIQQRVRETTAATKIQLAVRGLLRHLHRQRQLRLEQVWLGYQARMERHVAAVAMQTIGRGHLARMQAQGRRKAAAAVKIQALYRGHNARKLKKAIDQCTIS